MKILVYKTTGCDWYIKDECIWHRNSEDFKITSRLSYIFQIKLHTFFIIYISCTSFMQFVLLV